MKTASLTDLRCPATSGGTVCSHQLVLIEETDYGVPPRRADDDPAEVLEGVVRCSGCGEEYPIIASVLILVDGIETYLTRNNSEILAVAASKVSSDMVAYLERRGFDLHDVGYTGSFWHNNLGMGLYICAHYDDLASLIERGHPLESLIQAYSEHDFYERAMSLMEPAVNARTRALDIGCSVGGMAARLADRCEHVYAVDFSFRAALVARQILLQQPDPLRQYRLYREGLQYDIRTINATPRTNLEILVASGLSLPFAPESFDLMHCANVIDVVDRPASLVAEVLRVLPEDGVVFFADPYYWGPDRAPIENWFAGQPGGKSAEAFREILSATCDIIADAKDVLWILRAYDRYFTLWLVDCILARKRLPAHGYS